MAAEVVFACMSQILSAVNVFLILKIPNISVRGYGYDQTDSLGRYQALSFALFITQRIEAYTNSVT
jgi:hypothetical protein